MFRKYLLEPFDRRDRPLEFAWDQETGSLRGKDAERVHEMTQNALATGSIVSHPFPTSYDIRDPLHNISEMAVLLGQFWRLPEDLAAAHPVIEEEPFAVYIIEEDGTETLLPIQPLY